MIMHRSPGAPRIHACSDTYYSGMEMQASSEQFLGEVISAHKKRAMLIGKSQCEKKIAGEI